MSDIEVPAHILKKIRYDEIYQKLLLGDIYERVTVRGIDWGDLGFPSIDTDKLNKRGIFVRRDIQPVVLVDPSINPMNLIQGQDATSANLRITGYDSSTKWSIGGPGDATGNAQNLLYVWAFDTDFDGSTWNRRRGNTDVTVLSSAARTSTTNSADFTNYNAKGVRFELDMTAVSGTSPTLDFAVQSKDAVSGNYRTIPGATMTQKTGAGSDDLVVYPGVAETANETVSDILSRTWRVVLTIGGTTPSFTCSVGASLIV